ncbi:MAG TPA: LamG-like jellyroll fold domain-containing protein [Flavisolibacter sp.]|nr:LamG-like jellyroll fold domain-containing protein [Flavisolibacter sp.]
MRLILPILGASRGFLPEKKNQGGTDPQPDINDLLASYTFAEESGASVADSSGNNRTATLTGSYTRENGGVTLTNGALIVPSLLDTLPSRVTISFRIKPSVNYPNGAIASLVNKHTNTNSFFDCSIYPSGNLMFNFQNNGIEGLNSNPPTSFTAGQEYTISITWDAYVLTIFINNTVYFRKKKEGQRPTTGTPGPLVIGSFYDPQSNTYSQPFNGWVGPVTVRRHHLSTNGATAYHNKTPLVPTTQEDKFSQESTLILGLGPQGAYDENGSMEPSNPILENGVWALYYTALKKINSNDYYHTTNRATASNIYGPYNKDVNNPIFGQGRIGNRNLARCNRFDVEGTRYLLGVNSGIIGIDDDSLYLYKQVNGTWTDLGKLLDKTAIPGCTRFGNPGIWEQKVGGYYYMIMEGLVNNIWENHLFRSTSIESGWTRIGYSNFTIQSGQATGGISMKHDGTYWHAWYHSAGDLDVSTINGGNIPTRIFYARSTDALAWTSKQMVMGIPEEPFLNTTDQTADPSLPIEVGGKCYLFMSYMENGSNVAGQIRLHVYNGTLNSLLS